MGSLAEKLEKAGNEGDADFIRANTERLLGMYKETADLLSGIFDKKEDDTGKELIEQAKLNEAYAAMREIAQMFDYDSIVMVLNSVTKYQIPDEEKEKVESLENAIRNADWDKITRILG